MAESIDIQTRNFSTLISDIKKGAIRIPNFQREYIWQSEQVLELLDSVFKSYPIGSILLWETTQKLNEHDPLKLKLEELPEGHTRQYLLDGQQRFVTLYAVIHDNLEMGKKRKTKYQVFFDLKNKSFHIYKKKDLGTIDETPKVEDWFLPMNELMQLEHKSLIQNNKILNKFASQPEIIKNYVELFIKFNSLTLPAIIVGQELPIACKIFERLNNTGTPLTIVDLMVATTYNSNFNLREKLGELNSEFDSLDFSISERAILQCMSACFQKGTTRDHIIKSSSEIESKWKRSTEALKLSIDFLKQHCYVPVSRFIPNEILLSPLTYFFYKHGNKQLDPITIKKIKRYFWFNVLSQRYIQSQDSKAEEDITSMHELIEDPTNNEVFDYYVQKIDAETIKNTEMSFGSSFAKGILCFLASKIPLEFRNNAPVRLDSTFANANLKQLHHLFPQNVIKSEFGEKQKERDYINSIANISLISQTTNRDIWDKKPSVYFSQFSKENCQLSIVLKSHLLGDLNSFGINKDDFKIFIEKRSKTIAEAIEEFVKTLK